MRSYTFTFYKHIMFRHSCGKCHFTNVHRPSDITLADFWGWEKTDSHLNEDDKGISLVLVNTPKGKEIFEAVKHQMHIKSAELPNVLQANLRHPSVIHPDRMKFEEDYVTHGFKYVMCKYGDMGWKWQIRYKLGKVKRAIKEIFQ